jgi:hypothetical protein
MQKKENPKKRKLYEGAKRFQDGWTTQLPWAENVIGDKGLVHQVWCIMCIHVEGKEKLLAPKLDSLLKHVNCYKCKVSMPNVDTSFYYYNKNLVHANNEHVYIAHDRPIVLEKMLANVPIEENHKYMQFVVFFHLVVHGCPMTNYENLKPLLQLLKVKNLSIKHWSNTSSCSMIMHSMLLKIMKVHLLLLP